MATWTEANAHGHQRDVAAHEGRRLALLRTPTAASYAYVNAVAVRPRRSAVPALRLHWARRDRSSSSSLGRGAACRRRSEWCC